MEKWSYYSQLQYHFLVSGWANSSFGAELLFFSNKCIDLLENSHLRIPLRGYKDFDY